MRTLVAVSRAVAFFFFTARAVVAYHVVRCLVPDSVLLEVVQIAHAVLYKGGGGEPSLVSST
jgi:hypothetical protein